MSNTANTTLKPRVPTRRYRILAILFFLLTYIGLFLGCAGKWVPFLSHSSVVLYAPSQVALNGGELLKGSLFGYVYSMLKYFFTPGALAYVSLSDFVLKIVGLLQVVLLAAAAVLALVLGIAACLVRGKQSRRIAMFTAYFVTTAYLWVFLTALYTGTSSNLNLLGMKLTVDMPLLITVGAAMLMLTIVTLGRRTFSKPKKSFVGLVTVLIAVCLGAALLGFIYQETYTYVYTEALVAGALTGFEKWLFFALVVLFAVNIFFAIWRQNAKRFYPFDAVRYGLLFVAVVVMFVYFMIKPPVQARSSDKFTLFSGSNLLFSLLLLLGTLLAFVLSIVNAILVARRRRALIAAKANKADKTRGKSTVRGDVYADNGIVQNEGEPEAPIAEPIAAQQQAPNVNVTIQSPQQPVAPMTIPVSVNSPANQAPMPVMVMPMPMPIAQPAPAPARSNAPVPPAPVMTAGFPRPHMPGFMPPIPGQATAAGDRQQTPVVVVQQPENRVGSGLGKASEDFLNKMMALADQPPVAPEEEEPASTEVVPSAVTEVPLASAEDTYYGPYDAFLTPLDEPLKKEFNDLFIVKTCGDFGLPEYKVGGDNHAFFAKVFTRLGKFRTRISDDLLAKINDFSNK